MNTKTVSRNDPCPCGSGKKYKQCCQVLDEQKPSPNARLGENAHVLFHQAVKYEKAGQIDKATSIYKKILDIAPKHIDTLYNWGLLANATGRTELAIELLRKAVRYEPSAKHYCVLAMALQSNHVDEAMEYLHKAITLNPGDSHAYNQIGTLHWAKHRYEEAIPYYQKSIALNTKHDAAIANLGLCYVNQGKYQEAAKCFRQAITINPHWNSHYDNLLFSLCFDREDFLKNYLKEAHRLDIMLKARAMPYQQWNTSLTPNQPLRIGLVSGDFKNHPVGYFLESLLAHLNPSKIDIIAYSTQNYEDELTARIKPFFSQWVNITALNDKQAAEKIHTDGIHILIDLTGHTANNRLPMFAWKPAPIQVSWLGYFASTGLSFIDYFLADPISVPQNHRSHFTETVSYLPLVRLCFTPPSANIAKEPAPLPAQKNGFVTFGCFQNPSKINNKMIRLWAEILEKCPNSQLVLKNHTLKEPASRQEILNKLSAFNIPMSRVTLEAGSSRKLYFAAYDNVDLMLDTFPFPGGTTTCEALWMGVPTLTLSGNTLLERQGMSILSSVGLDDWIANGEADYVQKAINHAKSIKQLQQLRATLRTTMTTSPLVDAVRFAKDFEQVLSTMWHEKHQNQHMGNETIAAISASTS